MFVDFVVSFFQDETFKTSPLGDRGGYPFPNPSPKGEGSLPVFKNLAERYNYNEMIFYNDSFFKSSSGAIQ